MADILWSLGAIFSASLALTFLLMTWASVRKQEWAGVFWLIFFTLLSGTIAVNCALQALDV